VNVFFYIHYTAWKHVLDGSRSSVIPVDIAQSQQSRGMEGRMMWDLVRRVEGMGTGGSENATSPSHPRKESVGFAAKVIGIGVFAGLMLTYCNALIDACFRGLH
jgi:hypothetical protein